MDKCIAKPVRRERRKQGMRKTIRGTPSRPRLTVFRSLQHIYAQLIDDAAHPDAQVGPKRQTAALYDAIPARSPRVKPAGEINESAIIVRGDSVEHWLNGDCVLKYLIGSPELATAKAASKFKNEAKWGTRFPRSNPPSAAPCVARRSFRARARTAKRTPMTWSSGL